jgi:tetratricopeptide (TPR) repeat protein
MGSNNMTEVSIMDYLVFIRDIIKVIIWPAVIIFLLVKREWIRELIGNVLDQTGKISGLKIEIFGQKLDLESVGKVKKKSNLIEIDIEKIISHQKFSGAMPYISFREIEKTVYKIKALEIFGLNVNEINDQRILNTMGSYYYLKADFWRALNFYRSASNLSSNQANTLTNLGWVYMKINRNDSSLECFSKALDIDEKLPWAYLGRAILYKKLEQTDFSNKDINKAISNFVENIEKPNYDYLSFCGLARAYELDNKDKAAISMLDEAIKLRPDIALAYYNRSILRIKNKDLFGNEIKEAVFDLLRAIMRNPALRRYAIEDPDFEPLRDNPCYKCLIIQKPPSVDESNSTYAAS